MGQAPAWNYTNCMKHTQPRSHESKGCQVTSMDMPSSEAIISWTENTVPLELHGLYHSYPSTVML